MPKSANTVTPSSPGEKSEEDIVFSAIGDSWEIIWTLEGQRVRLEKQFEAHVDWLMKAYCLVRDHNSWCPSWAGRVSPVHGIWYW